MKNVSTVDSSQIKAAIKKYSHFLTEIRKRIIFILGVFVFSMFVGFFFYDKIIKLLIDALSLNGINIVFTSPFQFINLAISTGIAVGLVVTFPLIVYQMLSFLKPALKRKEFKLVTRFIPFSLFLFMIGFSFGAVIMKWQIQIFLSKSLTLGIGNILDISKLLTTVILTSSLMGLGFQFPILLLLLMRLGILKPQSLKKQRSWVYLGSFIFAILLPPDSILADVILSLPLIILYEVTLFLNTIFNRRKNTINTSK